MAGFVSLEFFKFGRVIEKNKKNIDRKMINFLKYFEIKNIVKKNKINSPNEVLSPER